MKNFSQLSSSQAHKIVPGPSIYMNFWEDPLTFFTNLVHEYGDIVCLDPDNRQVYLINHPKDIKHILQDNYRNYSKDADTFKLLIGNGLFVSEGDFWLRQRRMMQPAFHRQNIDGMIPLMVNAINEMLKPWQTFAEQGESIDISTEMTKLTIEISGSTMFGADLKNDANTVVGLSTTALDYLYQRGWDYENKLEQTPSFEERQFQGAVTTINEIIYRIIKERRLNKTKQNDLLSLLLHASDEETGNRMSEEQLRDEAVAMLIAGQSTTSVALVWIWYVLATHPDVESRIYTELMQVLGNRHPTLQDLPNLVYTRMVIDEVLRLYHPGWLTTRQSIGDDKIGGYDIPKGSEIFISPYLTHRNPAFWDAPERFDPERFSVDRSAKRLPFTYLPFGGGPHMCMGNHFSIMAIQLTLATVVQAYSLHLVSDQVVQPQSKLLLEPQGRILMTISKR